MIIISLGEIFSDAIRYPFSDITNFLIVGVIALIAGLSSILPVFQVNNISIMLVAAIVSLIFTLILSGYGVEVIKIATDNSDDVPDINLKENLITGIKALIIGIVYFIIPFVIAFLLAMLTGAIGAGLNHVAAALGVSAVIAIVVFIIFAIFETIAMARFAKSGDMGDALSIGAVLEDIKAIGVFQIIAFVIVALVIMIVAYAITSLLAFIPYAGIIVATILAGAFVALFYNRALGLLYSQL